MTTGRDITERLERMEAFANCLLDEAAELRKALSVEVPVRKKKYAASTAKVLARLNKNLHRKTTEK